MILPPFPWILVIDPAACPRGEMLNQVGNAVWIKKHPSVEEETVDGNTHSRRMKILLKNTIWGIGGQ